MKLKNTVLSVVIVCTALLLTSCKKVPTVAPSFVLVNVLDKNYYDMCHLKGSVNVPFGDVERYALEHWDKEKTEIVTYCSNYMCTASFQSAKQLQQLGFKKVWAYEGGAAEAKQKGFAMEGNNCDASWLENWQKEGEGIALHGVNTINFEELEEKIQKNAANN